MKSPSPQPDPAPDPAGKTVDFTAFYEATLTPLRRYLATLLRNNIHDAQDVAHDAYMRTFRVLHSTGADKPHALLFATARNLAINYRVRRADRMQPAEESALEQLLPGAGDPRDAVMSGSEASALEDAIRSLPGPLRDVVLLRHGTDLTMPQIASRLGIALSTAEKRLVRALHLLRAGLGGRPRT